MGIQINGQTDTIKAIDGTMTLPGTVTYEDVSRVNVTGVSTFAANVHISDSIAHLGDTDTAIRFPAADTFTVETGGTERFRIGSTGVSTFTGSVNPTINLKNTDTSLVADQVVGTLEFEASDSSSNSAGIAGKIDVIAEDTSPEYSMRFFTRYRDGSSGSTDERLRITSGGSVGIGTDNPKSDLQISNSGGLQVVNSNEIALRYNMYYNSGDKYIQASGKASSLVQNNLGQFIFYNTDTASSSADSAVSGLTSRLLLTSAGDMGLGSSNPYNTAGFTSLTIDNATTGAQIRFRSNGNERGLIYNTNSEFAIYAQNNIPLNFYNQGRVQAVLDYEGQFILNSQDATSYAWWRKQSPIILAQYGDYQRPVIALSYHRTSGNVSASGFFGDVIAFRGSTGAGHIPIFGRVCVSSAYTTNMRTGLGLGSGTFRFVTFTYDGNNYQGIQYNTDAAANILLDGWYAARGFKPFSVAQSSVTNLSGANATNDGRVATTGSSTL